MANDIYCGSYGCVIKSFFPCHNTSIEKPLKDLYITKFFGNEKYWQTEIALNERIREIDLNNDFTIKMVDYCNANDNELSELSKISRSNPSFNRIVGISNKYKIIYVYGGEDLDIFIASDYILGYFNILNFLRSFINIFDGIIKLNENGLVHFDIKPDNILYDKSKNRFTLIDFGLMQEKNAILTTNILRLFYQQQFMYYPSELNIFSYIVFDKPSNINEKILNINELIYKLDVLYNSIHRHSSNKPKLRKLVALLLSIINEIKEQLEHFNKFLLLFDDIIATLSKSKVIDKKYKDICKDEANDILSKVDVYMLGITLFNILLKIIRKLLKANKIDTILLIPHELFHLIKQMILLNPCDRIKIQDARDEYKRIFDI